MHDDRDQILLPLLKRRKRSSVKKAPESGRPNVARLKVTLEHVRPPIWRRLEVPAAISLGALHDILQIAFGWTNSHLHQFVIGPHRFGMVDDEFDVDVEDENRARLDQLLPVHHRFIYEYDFGDDWIHRVVLEKLIGREAGVFYPRCTAGKRAGPPEDCGGPWGYAEFLRAMRDPEHDEHESMREWIGGTFDAQAFDLAAVNRDLARLAKARRWAGAASIS